MAEFTVELRDDAHAVIDKVKTLIAQHGGRLEGDASGGSFEAMTPGGMLRGAYNIEGRLAKIDVHDKPWTIDDSTIEQVLRQYFQSHS